MKTSYQSSSARDQSARNALMIEHAPMARRIALRIARKTPDWISSDDLVSSAMIGLAEAAERWDATRGEPFVGFAEKRIRGAVLDELRKGDLLPRRQRMKAREVGRAITKLEAQLGRAPEDHEVAAALEVSLDHYREALEGLTKVSFIELPEHDGVEAFAVAPDAPGSPIYELERADLLSEVRRGLGRLPERDAILLSLYYVEELTYAEIGKVLEITESRVCQLHGRAMARLRAELGSDGAEAQAAEDQAKAAAKAAKSAARTSIPGKKPKLEVVKP